MRLSLNVVRCPPAAVPEQRRSDGADIVLGRGAECDWVLQDPERVLSKRHCAFEFRGGWWQLRDLSTNGTFLGHASEPIGRDRAAPVSDGDRVRVGAYELEVRVEPAAAEAAPWGEPVIGGAAPWTQPADPFASPLAPPPLPGDVAGALPADWSFDDAVPLPDHRPAASDAFNPPRVAGTAASLPDDWDFSLDVPGPAAGSAGVPTPGFAPPGGGPRAPLPPTAAGPFETVPLPRVVAAPADPVGMLPDAPGAAVPGVPVAPAFPTQPAPTALGAMEGATEAWSTADPFAEPEDGVPAVMPPPPPLPPVSLPPAAVPGDAAAGLAALLRGAGLPANALPGADPARTLEAAGACLRAAVAGLRALLIARADVKREFRIEQTMLRAAGNNPVKFAATDDAALAALLGAPGSGAAAVAATVGDLTAHEVATLAATQAAARALLERLAPAAIEAEAGAAGGLFASREKRLWDAAVRRHAQLAAQFEDDFDSAFGKAFARAYEQASGSGR